jgi:poly(A) polymerase
LIEQPRFRAGFDFLRLRAEAGELDESLARWWEDFSLADEHGRNDLIAEARNDDQHRRTRAVASGEPLPEIEPAKKKRRRRRKPAGAGAAPSDDAPST